MCSVLCGSEKCHLVEDNAVHACRTLSDCTGEMLHRYASSYCVINRTGHKDRKGDVADRGICKEPDKASERNLIWIVEVVPGVTYRNVRALTGVFGDTSASLAHSETLQQTLWLPVPLPEARRNLSPVLCLPAVHMPEMTHGMKNAHWDILVPGSTSQCCIQVVSQGTLCSKGSDFKILLSDSLTFMAPLGTADGIRAHFDLSHNTYTMGMLTS